MLVCARPLRVLLPGACSPSLPRPPSTSAISLRCCCQKVSPGPFTFGPDRSCSQVSQAGCSVTSSCRPAHRLVGKTDEQVCDGRDEGEAVSPRRLFQRPDKSGSVPSQSSG